VKGLLRSFLVHAGILWFIATNVGGIDYSSDIKILLGAALALTFVDSLIKPLINLFLLPFNLVTLGAFRWVSSVVALFLTTLIVPGFAIRAFAYPGLVTEYFIIPSLTLSLLGAYILIAILVSFLISLIFWLLH
jgi:putative membrane protein